ncbi:MAG: hypothetical protein R3E82_00235 [Pseudomonadales bacterium]|nr:hypothetical protein [Pseudomonadales bacterium]
MSGTDPMQRLAADRAAARARQDPCAGLCTVANVDESGLPQQRTLVLRDLEARLAVFVNSTSPKWPSLRQGPVSVLVWLPSLNVQYRLACRTDPVPEHLVHASWQLRPDSPKRLDWFYTHHAPQSSTVGSREELLSALASLALPEPLTAPPTAQGLYLHPLTVERLDLTQDNGVHDRRSYRRDEDIWIETTLTP